MAGDIVMKKLYLILGKVFYFMLTLLVCFTVGWLAAGRNTAWLTGSLTLDFLYMPIFIIGGLLVLLIVIRIVLRRKINNNEHKND